MGALATSTCEQSHWEGSKGSGTWHSGSTVVLTMGADQKGAGPETVIIGRVTNTGTTVQVLWGGPQDNRLEDRLREDGPQLLHLIPRRGSPASSAKVSQQKA